MLYPCNRCSNKLRFSLSFADSALVNSVQASDRQEKAPMRGKTLTGALLAYSAKAYALVRSLRVITTATPASTTRDASVRYAMRASPVFGEVLPLLPL